MSELVERGCEGCTACCIHFAFGDEFGEWAQHVRKDADVPCRFMREGGCAVYDIARPEICKDFICAWRLGVGDERFKPSTCGVLIRRVTPAYHFDLTHVPDLPPEAFERFFVFDELFPGALEQPLMAEFLRRVSQEFVVMTRSGEKVEYVGDKVAARRAKSIMGALTHYTGGIVPMYARITEWCFSGRFGSG